MDIIAKYTDTFFAETGKLLDELDALLLANESAKSFGVSDINEMFRITHTLKGSFGMMRLGELSMLSHALEGIFVALRREGGVQDGQTALFDIMFDALDAMRKGVNDVAANGAESRSFGELIKRIESFGEARVEKQTLRITLKSECTLENVRAFLIVSTLKGLCSDIKCWPDELDSDPDAAKKIRGEGLYISFPASMESAVNEALAKDIYIETIENAKALPSEHKTAIADESACDDASLGAAMNGYVTVSLDKLENLRNLASETALLQTRVAGELEAKGDPDAVKLIKVTDRLQSAVTGLMMIPVSSLFQKLHRAAREAGRKLDKQIAFEANGSNVEIDKGIIDALTESLIQIVRNAAVHGIESPAERLEAGKPVMGRIEVSARHSGTGIVVSVKDDGRGISPEAIIAAAEKAGLKPSRKSLDDEELLDIIMRPGVTTKGDPDEMSGRGVGLDVVKNAVEKLRGSVSLETRQGAGTEFFIRVPQSLAVMDCICFALGKSRLLIPAQDIYALVGARDADIIPSHGGCGIMRFRGYCLPVIDLRERYATAENGGETDGVFAVVEGEDRAAAVYAGRLTGPVKAAVKPLPALIDKLGARKNGICGCALMNDGGAGLMLDIEALLNMAKE